ncbi:MAG: ATP-dependent Clp protease proteolytic subunit [Patescibacteria group bacterium]
MAENEKQKLPFSIQEKDVAAWTGCWNANRKIMISGELNYESLRKVSLELMKLDYINNEPITLMIDSGGGNVVATHQLEDIISMINSPVDGLIMGDSASMAIDLLQMCRYRRILPSARILVHYIRVDQRWVCDDLERLEIDVEYFLSRQREAGNRRLALYVKRTGYPEERIKELFRHGEVHRSYFSAQQALELKLVDEIAVGFKFFPPRSSSAEEK